LNRTVLEQARQYDRPPPYICFAGMVFVPVTRNYLESWGRRWPREVPIYLRYLFSHSAELNTDRQRKEYVVLSEIMSDEINAYANEFKSQIVESINGLEIHGIEDIYKALKSSEEPFYTIRFMGNNNILRIDGEKARQAHQSILTKYDIPADARLESKL
jgi:hypothetical protein